MANELSLSAVASISGILGCAVACTIIDTVGKWTNHNCNTIWFQIAFIGTVALFFWFLGNHTNQYIFPRCIHCLFYDFLFQPAFEPQQSTPTIIDSVQNYRPWIYFLNHPPPRWIWLVYWFVITMIAIVLAPTTQPASTDAPLSETNTIPNQKQNSDTKIYQHNTKIIIARKWFHLIAILLFTPVTLLSSEMLSLSYSIAIAILIAFETIRYDIPFLNQFYRTNLDSSKNETLSSCTNETSNRNKTIRQGQRNNKITISHIGLVFGCAVPLWISQFFQHSIQQQTFVDVVANHNTESLVTHTGGAYTILSLWGIICLGVGDAMGAVIGTKYGRFIWGQQNRTIEGSIAMFGSMCLCCYIIMIILNNYQQQQSYYNVSYYNWLPACLFVTILEADTWQIDNFVLPMAGSILILLSIVSSS